MIMQLKLNKEYAFRHLFAIAVMVGMGLWFGYDGFIRYPKTEAAELYRSIEGEEPQPGIKLEAFKTQKTHTQYGFTFICLFIALVVGSRLNRERKFRFEFDDKGFTTNEGKFYAYSEIVEIDRTRWENKQLIVLTVKDDNNQPKRILLDGWHHLGVKELVTNYLNK